MKRLKADVAASDCGSSYFAQSKTDSPPLLCKLCWIYEARTTHIPAYSKFIRYLGDQEGQDRAPSL